MLKDFFTLLRKGRMPRADEVLALADVEMLRSIDDASRLDWLPAAPVIRYADEARTLLGSARWRTAHKEFASELAERPLFRALMQGAHVVFGVTPATFCKIFPRALGQAHRNSGSVVAEATGPRESSIRIEDCPPEGLSHGILDVFAGTFEGLLSPMVSTARTDVEHVAGTRRATIVVRW